MGPDREETIRELRVAGSATIPKIHRASTAQVQSPLMSVVNALGATITDFIFKG